MPAVSPEQFYVVLGSLSVLGGIAVGLKRIRNEMVEVASERASIVAHALLDEHVTKEHTPVMRILNEIQISVARVEVKLTERHGALADRIDGVELNCRTKSHPVAHAGPTEGAR